MFPEGMDMNALLEQAQAMQRQLADTQEQLSKSSFEGSAGGGLVKATVSGTGDLIGLEISPEAVDLDDLESLSDLVIAAFRDASSKANESMQQMMPNVGGLGL